MRDSGKRASSEAIRSLCARVQAELASGTPQLSHLFPRSEATDLDAARRELRRVFEGSVISKYEDFFYSVKPPSKKTGSKAPEITCRWDQGDLRFDLHDLIAKVSPSVDRPLPSWNAILELISRGVLVPKVVENRVILRATRRQVSEYLEVQPESSNGTEPPPSKPDVRDLPKPKVLRKKPAFRDKTTQARDKWIYQQCRKGVPYKEIVATLKRDHSRWQPIGTVQGIRNRAAAYAERMGLPPPEPRQNK